MTSTYYVSGGKLVRQTGTVIRTLGRGITSATFTAATGYVDVVLVSEQQMGRDARTERVTGHITLRNSNL
jgi:hypothetical protein